MELSSRALAWRERGRSMKALGMNVFVATANDDAPGTPLVLLHGFPTCSYDWRASMALFAKNRRVITLDFPGYGFSDKPAGFSYSLIELADVVEVVLGELEVKRAHLFAHDVGTSVTTELLARHGNRLLHFDVASVTLMNGSVHIAMSQLTAAQKLLRRPRIGPLFARLARFATFRFQMQRVFGRPDAVADEELEDLFALMRRDDGHLRLPKMLGYVDERRRFGRRWIGALETLDCPCLILWGVRDPVAIMAIAEKLARETPTARLVRMEDLGHYPQLEDPVRVVREVEAFLADVERV
jgi:pimeloyl-ACP methyl ester carboxylesterase